MKTENKTNFWLLLYILVPASTFNTLSNLLADSGNLAYTFLLTVLGLGLGFLFYKVTKTKTIAIKSIPLFLLFALPLLILVLSHENEVVKDWPEQKINSVSFSLPKKLRLVKSESPSDTISDFKKINIYNDDGDSKTTFTYSFELKNSDLIDLEDFFNQYLESFKEAIPTLIPVNIIEEKLTETSLYTNIKYESNGKELNGYCRIFQNKNNIIMFWFLPLKESYSKEYINKFDSKFKNNM